MFYKYTLKVYPKGMGRDVYRVIVIDGSTSLNELCYTILDSFDFDRDHLFEFCMDNKMYSSQSYRFPEDTALSIDDIGLEQGQKFTLHYDFGDDRLFQITVLKIEQAEGAFRNREIDAKGKIRQYGSGREMW